MEVGIPSRTKSYRSRRSPSFEGPGCRFSSVPGWDQSRSLPVQLFRDRKSGDPPRQTSDEVRSGPRPCSGRSRPGPWSFVSPLVRLCPTHRSTPSFCSTFLSPSVLLSDFFLSLCKTGKSACRLFRCVSEKPSWGERGMRRETAKGDESFLILLDGSPERPPPPPVADRPLFLLFLHGAETELPMFPLLSRSMLSLPLFSSPLVRVFSPLCVPCCSILDHPRK